jgi:hypothetical protein
VRGETHFEQVKSTTIFQIHTGEEYNNISFQAGEIQTVFQEKQDKSWQRLIPVKHCMVNDLPTYTYCHQIGRNNNSSRT